MKPLYFIHIVGGALLGIVMIAGTALANPAMLPDHPGHPMKAMKSPVTGQSLANDPGKNLWTGQKALQESTKTKMKRVPDDTEKDTNVQYKGAGTLPELAKGYPDYKINPPVQSAINPNR